MIPLLKQIELALDIWYTATDLGSVVVFPHSYQKRGSETVDIHLEWTTGCFNTVLPQGYGDSPVLYHNILQRNLGHLGNQNKIPIY